MFSLNKKCETHVLQITDNTPYYSVQGQRSFIKGIGIYCQTNCKLPND